MVLFFLPLVYLPLSFWKLLNGATACRGQGAQQTQHRLRSGNPVLKTKAMTYSGHWS